MYVMLNDFVLSPDVPLKRRLSTSTLDDLNAKYVMLLGKLKELFKDYSIPDIITGLCTADKGNLTFFASIDCLHSAKTIHDVFFILQKNSNILIL